MDDIFKIRGGKPLGGEISVAGSKNTILPCIAASLLTSEEVVFEHVPAISDVAAMVHIAEMLGVKAEWDGEKRELALQASSVADAALDEDTARKLRGSLLFSGALLARNRKAVLAFPGGDAIGARPLATYLNALSALGVNVREEDVIKLDGSKMRPGKVVLEESSVIATENTLLAASLLDGVTEIHLSAAEPHVQELMRLLKLMGVEISWQGIGVLRVRGRPRLSGARFRINPDELEVSSFAALAAAARSEVAIRGVDFRYLDSVMLQLDKMGVQFRVLGNDLIIEKPSRSYEGFRLQSGLFPKLVSDHLPPFAVLASQAIGESLIHEWLYNGRLRYIEGLKKMGANATILDPHRALIVGPTALYGAEIASFDIRSGMTMLIAALVAEGETVMHDVHNLDRGYEYLEARLGAIGADIERMSSPAVAVAGEGASLN